MSWLYLPGEAAGCSVAGCSDGERCATSKTTDTVSMCSRLGLETDTSMMPPSGTIYAPSMGSPGLDWWMSSLRASRASHLVEPENNSESSIPEICGQTPFASFERSDRNGSYWKMCQGFFPSLISGEYLQTWPKAGTIANGIAFRRRSWVRRIAGIGYGLWPTPTASRGDYQYSHGKAVPTLSGAVKFPTPTAADTGRFNTSESAGAAQRPTLVMMERRGLWPTPRGSEGENRQRRLTPSQMAGRHGLSLAAAVNWWPTPTTPRPHDSENTVGRFLPSQRQKDLTWAVANYPTPTAGMARSTVTSAKAKRLYAAGPTLTEVIRESSPGGQLNPNWVEWLMGWPIGWTDLEPLETGRFRQWLEQHGCG